MPAANPCSQQPVITAGLNRDTHQSPWFEPLTHQLTLEIKTKTHFKGQECK